MELIGYALGAIAVIAALIFVFVIIVKLFTNYVISRIISIGLSIAALVVALAAGDEVFARLTPMIILTALAWLFYIGPVVFDVHWDGSYEFEWVSDTKVVQTPRTTGGFIANLIGSLVFFSCAYFMLGEDYPAVFFFFPLAFLILNLIMMIPVIKSLFK